jgi:hypothetical protein
VPVTDVLPKARCGSLAFADSIVAGLRGHLGFRIGLADYVLSFRELRMIRSAAKPLECWSYDCRQNATIVHRKKAYCGKHALEKVDQGERADTWSDFFDPYQNLMGMRRMHRH